MSETRSCAECGGDLTFVDERRRTFSPDPETMTDGQLAEQYAAEMGGPFEEGVHGVTERLYRCSDCDRGLVVSG